MVTPQKWNTMTMAEQAEAWENMSEAERLAIRPDRKSPAQQESPPPQTTKKPADGLICCDCGTVGKPKTRVKGGFFLEATLWCFGLFFLIVAPPFGLLLLILAIAYTIWRMTSKVTGCPDCQGKMIATTTPRGRELWEQYHSKP